MTEPGSEANPSQTPGSRLGQICAGVIEAAWLAAVITVPLFFNVYSSRIFEPDKIALLRSLALLILAAWLVKVVDEGGFGLGSLKPGSAAFRAFLHTPLVKPVLALALVYALATAFSVAPAASFWGSYQRLQGAYTTFSYLFVFAALAVHMRRQAQVERLITAAILTSLPVSIYGILQRFHLDPIPWGGDVSERIAGNMGNSIFLAAYLILANPFTIIRIVQAASALVNSPKRWWTHALCGAVYGAVASVQLVALYFTGSRGPWLGWMAGSFFLFVLLSLYWRRRRLMFGVMGAAALLGVFLIGLNIPNGPLESLRANPYFGRLGHLTEAETDTGRVRVLIWQGAAQLAAPHAPLVYPDGRSDRLNAIRPLIGYGPESMYVAFTPFYPPELGNLEKRNAAPDRSHNETWDTLVITGVMGLAVYLTLFGSVLYYGLKWLGLAPDGRARRLYLLCTASGGAIGAAALVAWRGIAYFGIGLPFGMIAGVMAYLVAASLLWEYTPPKTEAARQRALVLIALVALVVAHFAEINFGIAIAATRTYFWTAVGLLLVTGYRLPRLESEAPDEKPGAARLAAWEKQTGRAGGQGKKKRRGAIQADAAGADPETGWFKESAAAGLILALVLVILGCDYISGAQGGRFMLEILIQSLTSLPGGKTVSFGMPALILITWGAGLILLVSEGAHLAGWQDWARRVGAAAAISLGFGLVFWVWQASALAVAANRQIGDLAGIRAQLDTYTSLPAHTFGFIFILVIAMGWALSAARSTDLQKISWAAVAAAPMGALAVLFMVILTNLRVVQADVAFKMGEAFMNSGQWAPAIAVYDQANALAPREDYYYLFLGRSYLEHARTIAEPLERDQLLLQAERDLLRAQILNPLNTDHTANLARLYSLWASFTGDPALRAARAGTSAQYFETALRLSPNNARIWDEWALLDLNVSQSIEDALAKLIHAAQVDPQYDWTFGLLGDAYQKLAGSQNDPQAAQKNLRQAADAYRRALELANPGDLHLRYSYTLSLANTEAQRGELQAALPAYEQALALNPAGPETWRIQEVLSRLYLQTGDRERALEFMRSALAAAPEEERVRLQSLAGQMESQVEQ